MRNPPDFAGFAQFSHKIARLRRGQLPTPVFVCGP
jgi:hypothetical protein